MKKFLWLLCLVLWLAPGAAGAERYAALTFDDSPHTRAVLEGLEQRGVRATFFLRGQSLADSPELAEEIKSGSHEIGLQGFRCEDMRKISRRDIARELMENQALLPPDCPTRFFRPPGGKLSDGILQVAKARGLSVVLWVPGSAVRNGDVVSPDLSAGPDAALGEVDRLTAAGFRLVTLSELAQLRRSRLHKGEIYRHFPEGRNAMEDMAGTENP